MSYGKPDPAGAPWPAMGWLRNCRVCQHAHWGAINAGLERGESLEDVASRHVGLTPRSLRQHLAHWPEVARRREAALGLVQQTTLEQARGLIVVVQRILGTLERAEDWDRARGYVTELRECFTLQAKLLRELGPETQVNVLQVQLGMSEAQVRQACEAWQAAPGDPHSQAELAVRVLAEYRARWPERWAMLTAKEASDGQG